MDIAWHGFSCFTLKGKSATLVTDPYDSKVAGIKMPKIDAQVCLANQEFDFHHAVDQLGSEVKVFDWPGEYEGRGIIVQAISAYDRPKEDGVNATRVLIFSIKFDGFKICHLSNIGHKLTPEMIEAIGDPDILTIPIGGTNCLDAKKAHEVVEQLDPRIVIPMYYNVPGSKIKLAELDPFLKEVGLHAPEKEKVLKLQTLSALPQDKTEFKILEPVLG